MAEATQAGSGGAPSDVLMALYMNDRDRARTLAAGSQLSLPELAAFGDLSALWQRLEQPDVALQEYSSDGWTALHLAAYFGYAAAVVVLLRAGASHVAPSRNAQGNTALHAAIAGRGEIAVISALLAAGSDPGMADVQGYAPLHLAASRGSQVVVELLLACGASREARTRDGRCAADLAAEREHHDLAGWLARQWPA